MTKRIFGVVTAVAVAVVAACSAPSDGPRPSPAAAVSIERTVAQVTYPVARTGRSPIAIAAEPNSMCHLHTDTAPADKGFAVTTGSDGLARFYQVRKPGENDEQPFVLTCTTADGSVTHHAVVLHGQDEALAPVAHVGTVRPALAG